MSGTSAERFVPITAEKDWKLASPTDITFAEPLATLGVADLYVADERSATPGTAKEPQTNLAAGRIVGKVEDGSLVCLKFIGTGSDNGITASGEVRIWLWERIIVSGSNYRVQWTKHLVGTVILTLGAKVGVANGIVDELHRYVDTITVVLDGGFTGTPLYARKSSGTVTADNEAVSIAFDGMGCRLWEVEATVDNATNITALNVLSRSLASA